MISFIEFLKKKIAIQVSVFQEILENKIITTNYFASTKYYSLFFKIFFVVFNSIPKNFFSII